MLSNAKETNVTLTRGADGLGMTVEEPKGVAVQGVDANSVAWRDGRIKAGDTIQGVDGADCFGYDGFVKRIKAAGDLCAQPKATVDQRGVKLNCRGARPDLGIGLLCRRHPAHADQRQTPLG